MHSFPSLLLVVLLILPTTPTLLQLVSLFRHGARYHLNTLYDGNSTYTDWGQLTSVGMRQHYNLGKLLQTQYSSSLSPTYNHSEVEVYSDDANRTINSVVSQLQGMFGKSAQRMPEGLKEEFKVPPYKYRDDIEEGWALPGGREIVPVRLNGPMQQCSNLSKEEKKNIADEHAAIDQMNTRYSPFFDSIKQIFNLSKFQLSDCPSLSDTLTVDRFLGRPLPPSFPSPSYQNLLHLSTYTHLIKFSGNVSRAVSTFKLSKILSVFDNRIKNPETLHKLTILSGHDGDIFPMLIAMNFTTHTCIEELYRFNKTNALNCRNGSEYASSIVWELHDGGKGYEVRVRVDGGLMKLCERDQTGCEYGEWKKRVQERLIIDNSELCPK